MFKKMFKSINNQFTASQDANLMSDRKTVIMPGSYAGYYCDILVFKKASLAEVKLGSYPIEGWKIIETVPDPRNRRDGFTICIKRK